MQCVKCGQMMNSGVRVGNGFICFDCYQAVSKFSGVAEKIVAEVVEKSTVLQPVRETGVRLKDRKNWRKSKIGYW